MENVRVKKVDEVKILDPYGFIYITTNMINGKKYIGQKMFRERWKKYIGSGKLLKRAVNKYGKENFYREIIAIAYSKEELNDLEIELINLHNAVNDNNYYNICFGGGTTSGIHLSDETRLKMTGPRSENVRVNMSNAQKGKLHSIEHKENISIAKKKFDTNQIAEIRNKYNTGIVTLTQLSEKYLVSQVTIWNVVNFKGTYK